MASAPISKPDQSGCDRSAGVTLRSRPAALAKPASGRRRAFLAGTAAGLAGAGLPLTFMALQLARSGGQTGHGLLVAWIVIGVIFIAMVAGLTGTVTIAISSPARRRRAGPAR